jgi:hypothetical protein
MRHEYSIALGKTRTSSLLSNQQEGMFELSPDSDYFIRPPGAGFETRMSLQAATNLCAVHVDPPFGAERCLPIGFIARWCEGTRKTPLTLSKEIGLSRSAAMSDSPSEIKPA